MVGRLPDARRAGRLALARAGDAVAIAGPFRPSAAASELDKQRGSALPEGLPAVDVAAARAAIDAVRDAVRAGEVTSAHDVAAGGLLVAVAECCLAGGIGAALDLGPGDGGDPFVRLFGEGPGGFVLSGSRAALETLAERVALEVVGTVGGDALSVRVGGDEIAVPLAELQAANAALERFFP
jgi:phosphoribosylformylglycinamidine synthase